MKSNVPKTTKLDVRLSAIQRGYLAEWAGPHGSLSSVVRFLIDKEAHREAKQGKHGTRGH